mgnify:CR=1 FL=1|jgi:hypothetical protein|tara:strand:+ start:1021 stop:1272 length:252 start_codon:yes stop_codon:yes gene_type:complete
MPTDSYNRIRINRENTGYCLSIGETKIYFSSKNLRELLKIETSELVKRLSVLHPAMPLVLFNSSKESVKGIRGTLRSAYEILK